MLMGDFNSLAPGNYFAANALVRYVIGIDNEKTNKSDYDGHPYLNGVVPPKLRFLNPVLRIIPGNPLLSALFNRAASLYAPRASIRLLLELVMSIVIGTLILRRVTFTSARRLSPAGRIDFIFASPEMAAHLETCYVLTDGEGIPGSAASDHLAIGGEFGLGIAPVEVKNIRIKDAIRL